MNGWHIFGGAINLKTRDRILKTSLEVFNAEGEANVTSVDIANELDISPGNLYYHFKGKDEIIAELYNDLHHELGDILTAPIDQGLAIRDAWVYLYLIFEQVCRHRYFYRNLNDLLNRYPDIARKFRQLLALKTNTAKQIALLLTEHGVIELPEARRDQVCEMVVMQIIYGLNFDELRGRRTPDELVMHHGVFQVMTLIAPYLAESYLYLYEQAYSLYKEVSGQ